MAEFLWERMKTMKQPDLRNLSRGELLEMLIQQGEELEKLRSENEAYRQQLEDKTLKLSEAGSIAEAALQVSGIFEAAQEASEQYLQSIRELSRQKEENAREASQLLAETEARCAAMKAQAQQQCDKMIEKAKKESLSYWAKVSRKLEGTR